MSLYATIHHKPCLCRIKSISQEIEALEEAKQTYLAHEDYPGEWSELIRIAGEEIERKKVEIELLKGGYLDA
jgi:hypothetical protein